MKFLKFIRKTIATVAENQAVRRELGRLFQDKASGILFARSLETKVTKRGFNMTEAAALARQMLLDQVHANDVIDLVITVLERRESAQTVKKIAQRRDLLQKYK